MNAITNPCPLPSGSSIVIEKLFNHRSVRVRLGDNVAQLNLADRSEEVENLIDLRKKCVKKRTQCSVKMEIIPHWWL